MNLLLSLNKKLFLIIIVTFLLIFIFLISLTYFQSISFNVANINIDKNNADITNPKFSINSDKQKISITANEANFLTKDEILLEKNVVFKSNKFKIISDNVIFDKKKLIASSNNNATFTSRNTFIESNGFDIIENGNIINFKGKTKLKLK